MQTRQAGLEGTGEIKLRHLVKEALRMRPSRIVGMEKGAPKCRGGVGVEVERARQEPVRPRLVKTNYLTYFRVSRGAATYDDSQLPFNLDSN